MTFCPLTILLVHIVFCKGTLPAKFRINFLKHGEMTKVSFAPDFGQKIPSFSTQMARDRNSLSTLCPPHSWETIVFLSLDDHFPFTISSSKGKTSGVNIQLKGTGKGNQVCTHLEVLEARPINLTVLSFMKPPVLA